MVGNTEVLGEGGVEVQTKMTQEKIQSLIVKDVLHVPNYRTNFFCFNHHSKGTFSQTRKG